MKTESIEEQDKFEHLPQKVYSPKKKKRDKKPKAETIPFGSTLLSTRLNNSPKKNLWRLKKFEGKLL